MNPLSEVGITLMELRLLSHLTSGYFWSLALIFSIVFMLSFREGKPSDARHHPPRRAVISDKFSIRAAPFAAGCMPLLYRAPRWNQTSLRLRDTISRPA